MKRPAHKCRGYWYGSVDTGWTAKGTRERRTISGRTEAEVRRRLAALTRAKDDGNPVASDRTTVKAWAETYLELRRLPPKPLSPNGWNAAASPIRKWIIPTIGNKRLSALTPADVRAVAMAQYDAGRKTSTADATQRVLMTMLKRARAEGHRVPDQVMLVDRPGMGVSDRRELSLPESLACLAVSSQMAGGIRWLFALLYGARQGEVLGMTEGEIDWEAKVIRLEWQLQDLQREHGCAGEDGEPTCGKKPRSCPVERYRIPRDYEAVQIRGMYHLVRPKSQRGYRVLPLIPPVEEALRAWLQVRPANEHGLVFVRPNGRPVSDKDDRAEFQAIQAQVKVAHPSGRPYHVHECRNFFATQAGERQVDDKTLTELIGHASIRTTRGYQGNTGVEAKRQAILKIAAGMGLVDPEDD